LNINAPQGSHCGILFHDLYFILLQKLLLYLLDRSADSRYNMLYIRTKSEKGLCTINMDDADCSDADRGSAHYRHPLHRLTHRTRHGLLFFITAGYAFLCVRIHMRC
jgi:hypothetical protein